MKKVREKEKYRRTESVQPTSQKCPLLMPRSNRLKSTELQNNHQKDVTPRFSSSENDDNLNAIRQKIESSQDLSEFNDDELRIIIPHLRSRALRFAARKNTTEAIKNKQLMGRIQQELEMRKRIQSRNIYSNGFENRSMENDKMQYVFEEKYL